MNGALAHVSSSQEITRLIDENEALRARIEALEEALGWNQKDDFALARIGLPRLERKIVLALLKHGALTYEALHSAIYGGRIDGGPNLNIIKVTVCKARPLLEKLGITVETVWGTGLRMPEPSRGRLRAIIAEHGE
jgi:hypothetical protein